MRRFDKQHWRTVHVDQDTNTVTFELISPHGQNGYPGRLLTSVAFNLSENGEFTIEYEARLKEKDNYEDPTQRANDLHSTLVSLTNHSYWNLDGVLNTTTTRQQNEDGTEPVLSCDCHIKDHTLWLSSSDLVELGDIHPVPTGRILDQTRQQPSQETAADQLNFTQTGPSGQAARALGPGLDKIPGGYGYDHVYSLVPAGDASLLPSSSRSFPEIQGYYPSTPHVATLYSPRTGIQMELSTSEPALVLYASGYLDSTLLPRTKSKSKSTSVQEETSKTSNALVKAQEINAVFGKFSAICLEPIRFPDAIHHPDWASMVTLHAGEVYRQRTIHKFSTR
ncbi:hypothetical protein BGZ94_007200 [Podila epigama]|nr:hypothetical protein BGZ94_007200 [Podila epigama]